jgi:palmitoyltransferase
MTVSDVLDTRAKLIEWESVYDLITLLNGLEYGVPKKPLVEVPNRAPPSQAGEAPTTPLVERPYAADADSAQVSTPPPHIQEPAHKFSWSGIKAQIFHIIATLLQPPPGRSSPGNPIVQDQMLRYDGMIPLLNCCVYDDHNPFAKERVTICLKWLMEGSEAANNYLRNLLHQQMPAADPAAPQGGGPAVSSLRVDGIAGEVKVQVRPKSAPVEERSQAPRRPNSDDILELLHGTAKLNVVGNPNPGTDNDDDDFM